MRTPSNATHSRIGHRGALLLLARMVLLIPAFARAIETIVRAQGDEEAELLACDNAGHVFTGEHELALAMTRHVLERATAR